MIRWARNLSRRGKIIAVGGAVALMAVVLGLALPVRWTEDELRQVKQLRTAMVDIRAAIGLVARHGGALEPAQADEVLVFYEHALAAANSVDDAVLAKVHKSLPDVWHEKLQRSTQIYVNALKQRDRDLARQAALLQDDWIRWYNLNHEKMRLPPPESR